MKWEIVKVKTSKAKTDTPIASVGLGRISLNSAACELIDNFEQYTHAIFMKARKDNKLCFGIQFLKEEKENSIKITRRIYNGEVVKNSCSFNNKALANNLFGAHGTDNKTKSYCITLDNEDKTILIIIVE